MVIAFDAFTRASDTTGTSQTTAHTCSGSDRLLVVITYPGESVSGGTTATYNGVSMTKIISQGVGLVLFILKNPDSGTHNVVVNTTNSTTIRTSIASYTGCDQTTQPGVYGGKTNSTVGSADDTVSLSVPTNDSWLVCGETAQIAEPVSVVNGVARSSLSGSAQLYDSNGTVASGTQTIGAHWSSSDTHDLIAISISPVSSGPSAPTVDTQATTGITHSQGTLNGEITDTGGEDADERGFVWGTSTQTDPGDVAPASAGYDDYFADTGTFPAETFDHTITGLSASTTYYVRAYAHNSAGYSYGDEISFDTDAAPSFRFENIKGVVFDEDDHQTIFAERLNDILDRLDALEG